MKVSSRDEAIGALRAVTLTVEGLLPQRDISSIWELIDAGEPGIAFENLCTQLYEYENPSTCVCCRMEPGVRGSADPDNGQSAPTRR
jgi:hypothetical protein